MSHSVFGTLATSGLWAALRRRRPSTRDTTWALVSSLALISVLWPPSRAAADTNQQRVAVCHTSQGNGFNWAASLGWLAESFDNLALQAATESEADNRVFDIRCVSGSSSAAATVALVAALLDNQRLFPSQRHGNHPFEPDELRTLGRALRLLALAADFQPDEQAAFALRYLVPDDSGKAQGAWWQSRYGEDLIRHSLARRIHLAARLRRDDLFRQVEPEQRYSSEASSVTDIIESQAQDSLPQPGSSQESRARRFLKAQRQLAQRIMRDRLGGDVWNWNQRADSYLRQTPAPQGFMTTTFALLQDYPFHGGIERETNPPAFTRLTKLAIGAAETIRAVAQSDSFSSRASDATDDEPRFALASVTNLYDLLRLSQAEPENQRVVAGSAHSLGISELYEYDESTGELIPQSTERGLVIAGGWTPPETSATPLLHYGLDKAQNDRARHVVARRFGKPGRTATFPALVMERYFFRNRDGSSPIPQDQNLERYMNVYYGDATRFDNDLTSLFGASQMNLESSKTTFNWDIARRPAAAANLSQHLLLSVTSVSRAQLSPSLSHPKPFVFIPPRN